MLFNILIDHKAEQFACYSHWHMQFRSSENPNGLFYIGHCPLTQLFDYPDARRNSRWPEIVRDLPQIGLHVHHIGSQTEAAAHAINALVMITPICNAEGTQTPATRRAGPVRCLTTGLLYPTAAAAASAAFVSPATLANHLNNPAKHKTCAGMVFKRYNNDA